jgi:hypothetical protein
MCPFLAVIVISTSVGKMSIVDSMHIQGIRVTAHARRLAFDHCATETYRPKYAL